jgi:hypothetical protein
MDSRKVGLQSQNGRSPPTSWERPSVGENAGNTATFEIRVEGVTNVRIDMRNRMSRGVPATVLSEGCYGPEGLIGVPGL